MQKIEHYAQDFAARIIAERAVPVTEKEEKEQYSEVDISTLDMMIELL
jgi:hypothetical protein